MPDPEEPDVPDDDIPPDVKAKLDALRRETMRLHEAGELTFNKFMDQQVEFLDILAAGGVVPEATRLKGKAMLAKMRKRGRP